MQDETGRLTGDSKAISVLSLTAMEEQLVRYFVQKAIETQAK